MLTATAPKLRASRLPLITLCPKSALLDDEPIDSEDSPARLGSAFHQIIAKHVMGHQVTYDDIDQTAIGMTRQSPALVAVCLSKCI